MPTQNIIPSAVLPVFVLEKWIPASTSVYDICTAAEKVSGAGTIDGATCISGLWRIYPLTDVARVTVLTKGIVLGNKTITLEHTNPFSFRRDGSECQGTRLTISNLPFSYSNEAVEKNLVSAGLKLRSKILFEKARGPDRLLTDWRNGKRFVWIDLPAIQPKKSLKMGTFTAYLFYREMKNSLQCRRCLKEGHKAIDCPNDEVCLSCKMPGHRRGDPICVNSEKVRGTRRDHLESEQYRDLWWGRDKNDTLNVEECDNEADNEEGEDLICETGNPEKEVENSKDEKLDEELFVEPGHSEITEVSTDKGHDTSNEENAKEIIEESVSDMVEVEEQQNVIEVSKDKDDETVKVSEIEEGEIIEEANLNKVSKITYKEKLVGSPTKENLQEKKNKQIKKMKTGSDSHTTPVSQRGMVQSILNFVGKRSSETLSPDGPGSKPQSKRPAKAHS